MARGNQGGSSGWAWLLTGVFIGLFVAFLIYLNDNQPQTGQAQQTASKDEPKKPKFNFYNILTKMEVPVNLDQPAGQAPKGLPEEMGDSGHEADHSTGSQQTDQQAVADLPPGSYIIQAGSFSKFAEADRLKASLSLLGIQAQIQTVKLDNGQTWHRVRIGPYTDMAEVEKTQKKLAANDVHSIVIKLKQ